MPFYATAFANCSFLGVLSSSVPATGKLLFLLQEITQKSYLWNLSPEFCLESRNDHFLLWIWEPLFLFSSLWSFTSIWLCTLMSKEMNPISSSFYLYCLLQCFKQKANLVNTLVKEWRSQYHPQIQAGSRLIIISI